MLRAGHVYIKKKIPILLHENHRAIFFRMVTDHIRKINPIKHGWCPKDYFVPERLIFNVTIIIFYKHMAILSKPLCA